MQRTLASPVLSKHCPLSICAVAFVLAGCGGSQLAIRAPFLANTDRSPSQQRTFLYTGKKQSFRVPSSVTSITVVARGATGGGARARSAERVVASIPVTPGETLSVFVGGAGTYLSGGFNGGGSGDSSCNYACGYGGGGASDIREGGDKLTDRIVVAAGGGGQGGDGDGSKGGAGGKGGDRHGASGGSGTNGYGSYGPPYPGGGGAGGTRRTGGAGGSGGSPSGESGSAGSLGIGGAGGDICTGTCMFGPGPAGGGGGGGYYGGGGGGAAASSYGEYGPAGGGGGGGSSYVERSAHSSHASRVLKSNAGNGLVMFRW